MAAYKPSESKKDEFRKYLEHGGVIDALTKVLVELYEEPDKPQNALEFVKQAVSASGDVASLQEEVKRLREENAELKKRLEEKGE